MRRLVSHECSGAIRRALRARGVEAWSNDLQPAEDGGQHIHGPAEEAICWGWDGIVIHIVCTEMAVSGNGTYGRGRPKHHLRIAALRRAARLVGLCREHAPRVVVENPVSVLHQAIGPATQTVQPWWFGDPFYKATSLWLWGVPPLVETNRLKEPVKESEEWKRRSKVARMPRGPNRSRERSRTFPGIAEAIADSITRPLPLWDAAGCVPSKASGGPLPVLLQPDACPGVTARAPGLFHHHHGGLLDA